jgi:osmotically-inducible protein OsmY
VLQRTIVGKLRRDPTIDDARIQVSVLDGAAVLSGAVRTYAEKCRAESLVCRVRGVSSLRNDIDVRITIGDYRTDAALERVLRDLFEALAQLPERPAVTVRDGWVTLEGEVARVFQKTLVENAVRDIAGVRGITNQIAVVPRRR